MPRRLTYEEKLRRAEAKELNKARRKQQRDERKRAEVLKQRRIDADLALKKAQLEYQQNVNTEAKRQYRAQKAASKKRKRTARKILRRLI